MDGPSLGKAFADAAVAAVVMTIVLSSIVSIGLWELFWFLWEHVSFSWK